METDTWLRINMDLVIGQNMQGISDPVCAMWNIKVGSFTGI